MTDKTLVQLHRERQQLEIAKLEDRIQSIENGTARGLNVRDGLPSMIKRLAELTGHRRPIRFL